ncbi:7-cyano-7-deazaguanine synthase QueC [Caldifermentibacillus hisashii]|uniref:7-cyano-7-deazaguanine synthase QueC n=1 Tax=Caldifermentibacillus hisashii TaxID=996558 RepID=UPI003D1BF0E2
MLKDEKAVVVFSGGQDSTTCLFWALNTFQNVEAVTFDYNQRHKKEIECAKSIAEELKVKHHILDMNLLNQLSPSALTRMDIDVKAGKSGELPSSFVPGRNLIFLSMAAILAQQIGAKHLVTGVCETDFSGYPDCRDVFVKSLNVTINLAMGQEFVIHTPLMWLDKAATWKMADDLNVLKLIKERTLTCYEGIIGDGCGKCPACQLRRQSYEKYMQMKANVSTAI